MSKYILGVDGGATKSHLAVFDAGGRCAGTTTYGALNHEAMDGSYSELEERLRELLPRTLRDAGADISDIAFAVFGLAGVDTKSQEILISDIVRKIGIKNFVMCNDAVLGVPAGCPGGVGVCAINGTGFKLAAIDHSGVITDTCGLGLFTDDRGGGTWYGQRACGEVYNALYKLGRPTVMRRMLFDFFGVEDKAGYLGAIIERIYHSEDGMSAAQRIALNSVPFEAAALGDEVALDLLDESAAQYGGAIARLAMDMDFPCSRVLHVTFAGSVFVKQKVKILHDMVKRHVAEILGSRQVEYTVLDAPPVFGAVILAAQRAGFPITPATIKEQLKVLY